MKKNRRKGAVFLILGTAFNSLGITNKEDSLKTTFIAAGTIFLIIALVIFLKEINQNKEENKS